MELLHVEQLTDATVEETADFSISTRTLKELDQLISTYKDYSQVNELKNGHILYFYNNCNKNVSATSAFIQDVLMNQELSGLVIATKVKKMLAELSTKKKNIHRPANWCSIVALLDKVFEAPIPKGKRAEKSKEIKQQTDSTSHSPAKRLKKDCENCPKLRKINIATDTENKKVVQDLHKKIYALKAENKNLKHAFTPSKINQDKKRKNALIRQLKLELQNFKKSNAPKPVSKNYRNIVKLNKKLKKKTGCLKII